MTNLQDLEMRRITFYFTILCALFLMLSSQFTGAILPLLFIIPIIMGLIGIKRRRKSGYLIGLSIVPLSVAISVLWIRYSISVFNDFSNQIAAISTDYNTSVTIARAMTISFFVLSIIMMIVSITLFVKLRKNRKLFT